MKQSAQSGTACKSRERQSASPLWRISMFSIEPWNRHAPQSTLMPLKTGLHLIRPDFCKWLSVFGLFTLILMPAHICAADHQAASGDSIRFIALPYLDAFHNTERGQATIISRIGSRQNLTDYQWRISATSIPDYRSRSDILQIIDPEQTSGPRLVSPGSIIIPLPNIPGPINEAASEKKPLWIQMRQSGITIHPWRPPSLTPVAAALAIAEQQRKARLAKRMADRAFYFGYDTNKDALK